MQTPLRILTFDLEEWFHILEHESTRDSSRWMSFESRIHRNTERILTLLLETHQQATFFCLGWVAENYPEVVRTIHSMGFDVASHSHEHRVAAHLGHDEFRRDLLRSMAVLEDATGRKVRAFRAPGFSMTRESTALFDIMAEAGIDVDCSIFPAARAHGGFADFGSDEPVRIKVKDRHLMEFPIRPFRLRGHPIMFSGGGYFRLLPYPLIRLFMRSCGYVMTYFHPRDFDPLQPALHGLSLRRRFKTYIGLGLALGKLRRLLTDFSFVDLRTAENRIDWKQRPTISF